MLRIFFIVVINFYCLATGTAQKNSPKEPSQTAPSTPQTTEDVVERLAAFPPYEQVLAQLFASQSDEQLPHPDYWSLDRNPEGWRLRDRSNRVFWIWRADSSAFADELNLPAQPIRPDFPSRAAIYSAWTEPGRAAAYGLNLFVGYPAANRHTVQALPLPGEWPPHLLQALGLANLNEARRILLVSQGLADSTLGTKADAEISLSPDSIDRAEAHFRQAVDAYRRLNASSPEYNALEGRPVLSLDLALAEAWYDLHRIGHTARGKGFLEQVRFSPYYTSYGRNLLMGLPDSAVLLCPDRLELLLLSVVQYRDAMRQDVRLLEPRLYPGNKPNPEAGQCMATAPVPDEVLMPATAPLEQSPQSRWIPQGLFARWSPSPENPAAKSSGEIGHMTAPELARLYTDQFRYPAVTSSLNRDPTAVLIAHRYRRSALQTAQTLAALGQAEEGLRLLNVLYRHLPEWVVPMQIPDLPVIAFYYQQGSAERAGEMGMALGKLLAATAKNDTAAADALTELKDMALEHGQNELLQYYERLGP